MPGIPGHRLVLGDQGSAECRDDHWFPQQGPTSKRLALLHRLSLTQHGVDVKGALKKAGLRIEDLSGVYSPYCDALLALPQVPQVITCHDLTPLYVSNSRKASFRYRYWTPRHLNQAKCIIAISHFVADQLVDFGVPASKIEVIYNGIAIEREPITEPASQDLLMLARHDRNKNVAMVVRAFGQLLERLPQWQGRLVVVGRSGRQTPELKKILRQLSKPGKIVLLDGVNTAELVKLFRSSLALVSASTMEGFDYPLLEAKAEGLPTIISDIPVHHEIHENTSLYFNPEQGSDELIEAIVGLAYDQTLWDYLSVSGRNLIAKFTITEQQSRIRKLLS
jgi:glycosyltransferase involved in cell wall biosynthesis